MYYVKIGTLPSNNDFNPSQIKIMHAIIYGNNNFSDRRNRNNHLLNNLLVIQQQELDCYNRKSNTQKKM